MSGIGSSAFENARWRAQDALWLDHSNLSTLDVEWLEPIRRLTVWAVKMPAGLLASLPNLESLDFRGGSGTDAAFVEGCAGLRSLSINQVRGLSDLSHLTSLTHLRALDLFGLPQVTHFPSLEPLGELSTASIGSMRGLTGISGLLAAPSLTDLRLLKRVGVSLADARAIRDKTSIERFEWMAEDVPKKVWLPFVELATGGRPQ